MDSFSVSFAHQRLITSEYLLGFDPEGGTPYNGIYGEAPPEMGTFLRLQVQRYERVGISLVEVYERVGIISVSKKRVQKG